MEMITSSRIFELIGCFSKLQELNLNFWICKLSADAEVSAPTTLPSVKTLRLYEIDFRNEIMVSCVIDMICACSNLETLLIKATYEDDVPAPAISSSQVDFSRIREMQLRKVVFVSVRGLENEVCLMKSLLEYSPLLKEMDISGKSMEVLGGHHGALMFATKLLKLHRASPVAEIDFDFR
ncbi:F-box domain, FBD domain, Leucine-rich repeat domain, L domain-like protein [Artemisia annua]|uniref:F-box domain, FBD domain, Leucine-rich repeat domain, L domain-like protein n=1 Tax=Artemisia annua TaxID=35608 RepID=A0A2U1NK16_ARTAN|nr:F-box domain, FBD domain, Leucine-rich repeat domain, L domain-like protein [Artemisia annua]